MKNSILNKLLHPDRIFKRFWYRHWNKFKFNILGIKLGKNSTIWSKVYLYVGNNAKVNIGDDFALFSGDNHNPLCANVYCSIRVEDGTQLSIGNNCGISGGGGIWVTDSISIGNNVHIGANCTIIDGDIHNIDWKLRKIDRTSLQPIPYKHSPISIGDDVWLGANCIVLKGVHIGPRTIIGAGSIVTKDIPSDCIAAGNPCKVIKNLI